MQPAIHAGKSFREIALGMAKGKLIESARKWNVAAEQVSQQLLVETLDRRQDCQLKFEILGQKMLPRARLSSIDGILYRCSSKDQSHLRRKLPAERHCYAPGLFFWKYMAFRVGEESGCFGELSQEIRSECC
jgi:hypothetical protein